MSGGAFLKGLTGGYVAGQDIKDRRTLHDAIYGRVMDGEPGAWGGGGDSRAPGRGILDIFAGRDGIMGQGRSAGDETQGQTGSAANRGGWAGAISSIESDGSGGYRAIGPETRGGNRAYGRYQVMDFNIGPWTQKHYGQRLTPEQFLANDAAQDAVFDGEFGSYVEKYGSPEKAARVWFGGRGALTNPGASDGYITVDQYAAKFNKALGQSTAGSTSAPAVSSAVLPASAQAAPQAAAPASDTMSDMLNARLGRGIATGAPVGTYNFGV